MNDNQKELVSNMSIPNQLRFWDLFLSGVVHKYENLSVTCLLLPPSLMFNPHFIAIPIFIIWYNTDFWHTFKYIVAIGVALAISTYMKRYIKRPRPAMVQGLTMKPSIIRKRENNFSMPSGDSIQAGVFLYTYLNRFDEQTGCTILLQNPR